MPNYGVTDAAGQPFPSKTAFRKAVTAGERVKVFSTSIFENVFPPKQLTDLQPSDVIVGPDPFAKRDWYANVKVQARTGRIFIV
jgi:hypothetical protein